jgi:hypothetical protein
MEMSKPTLRTDFYLMFDVLSGKKDYCMKQRLLKLIAGIGIMVVPLLSETITGVSVPFAFPAQASIKAGIGLQQAFYFQSHLDAVGRGSVSICWSLPEADHLKGTLSIYTLAGKKLESYPIEAGSGRVLWRSSRYQIAQGIYYARLQYGNYSNTLKTVMFH